MINANEVRFVTLSDIPGAFLTADMEGRVIILLEVENYTQAYIQNHLVQPEGKTCQKYNQRKHYLLFLNYCPIHYRSEDSRSSNTIDASPTRPLMDSRSLLYDTDDQKNITNGQQSLEDIKQFTNNSGKNAYSWQIEGSTIIPRKLSKGK